MTRVVVLPIDDRPVTFDAPARIGRMLDLEVVLPERCWLGTPWRSGDPDRLVTWLERVAPTAEALILAVDAVLHGGLVPSRRGAVPARHIERRLETLRNLRSHTDADIAVFNVVQRMNRGDSPNEEAAYWARYGASLFRLSTLEHRSQLGVATGDEAREIDALRRTLPAAVIRDFLAIRERNHAINRTLISYLDDGFLDYLVLAQDDTSEFGWNVAEAMRLREELGRRELAHRSAIFAGCDEIASLLLARFAARERGFRLKVWPRYSTPEGPTITTSYEDRPLGELLEAQLAVVGGRITSGAEEADLALFVHGPRETQGCGEFQWLLGQSDDAGLPLRAREARAALVSSEEGRRTMSQMRASGRDSAALVRSMETVPAGVLVALADVAYSNGADLALGDAIAASPLAPELASYGAWNTAGNTLGLVLAHALVRVLALRDGPSERGEQAHLEFLFLRLLDDYAFQAHDRALAMFLDLEALGQAPSIQRLPAELVRTVLDRLEPRIRTSARRLAEPFIASGKAADVRVENVDLPWGRLFEIACEIEILPGLDEGPARKGEP